MVNENKEPVQAPLPESDGGNEFVAPPDNPIIAEVDRLNGTADVSTAPAPAPEAPAEPAPAPPPPTTDAPAPEATTQEPQPNGNMPPVQQPSAEEYQRMQQQAIQYQEVQQKAQLQQEAQRYQQQLESQGYLQDQAQQIAYQYMQSRQSQVNMQRTHQQQINQERGKQNAAEHFAQKYSLTFEDMSTLKLAESPEQMEGVAKQISDTRNMKTELDQLRKQQVPPQQYDNSQGAPEVAANDGSWLDRYNRGDRSANAVAAAKKVLGI